MRDEGFSYITGDPLGVGSLQAIVIWSILDPWLSGAFLILDLWFGWHNKYKPLNNFMWLSFCTISNEKLCYRFCKGFVFASITTFLHTLLQVAKKFMGYLIAIVIGFLFVIFMPLIGLCFCCCRMCGNCGGTRNQQETDDMHMWRRVLVAILFATTVFMLYIPCCVNGSHLLYTWKHLYSHVDV